MKKSVFHSLSAVAVATSLLAGAPAAQAAATADMSFDSTLLSLLGVFGVSVGATGSDASYASGTFSSGASDVLAGDTTFSWLADSGLAFTVTGNGTLTFDTLVYDSVTSTITSDLHYVNGATTQEFGSVTVFNVGALSPAFDTLASGGSSTGTLALSAAGLAAVASALNITVAPTSDLYAGTLTLTTTAPAVPEPGTWALSLAGLAAVAAGSVVRRRRQG